MLPDSMFWYFRYPVENSIQTPTPNPPHYDLPGSDSFDWPWILDNVTVAIDYTNGLVAEQNADCSAVQTWLEKQSLNNDIFDPDPFISKSKAAPASFETSTRAEDTLGPINQSSSPSLQRRTSITSKNPCEHSWTDADSNMLWLRAIRYDIRELIKGTTPSIVTPLFTKSERKYVRGYAFMSSFAHVSIGPGPKKRMVLSNCYIAAPGEEESSSRAWNHGILDYRFLDFTSVWVFSGDEVSTAALKSAIRRQDIAEPISIAIMAHDGQLTSWILGFEDAAAAAYAVHVFSRSM